MGQRQVDHAQLGPCMPRHDGGDAMYRAFFRVYTVKTAMVRARKPQMRMTEDHGVDPWYIFGKGRAKVLSGGVDAVAQTTVAQHHDQIGASLF